MRIHKILPESVVNGPGKRWVVWVQGCKIHCPGCSNEALWPFEGGQDITPKALADMVPSEGIDGITITGGEPFNQPLNELEEFLQLVYKKVPSVMVTTGYLYKDLSRKVKIISKVTRISELVLLKYIDILVDGPYEFDKPDNTTEWRGSTNQIIHFLTSKGKKFEGYKSEFGAELRFDGLNVEVTGFGVPEFIKKTLDGGK